MSGRFLRSMSSPQSQGKPPQASSSITAGGADQFSDSGMTLFLHKNVQSSVGYCRFLILGDLAKMRIFSAFDGASREPPSPTGGGGSWARGFTARLLVLTHSRGASGGGSLRSHQYTTDLSVKPIGLCNGILMASAAHYIFMGVQRPI